MFHHDRAFDSAAAYDLHIAAGISTAYDHLTAAALASDIADAEYLHAAMAATAGERRMFLHAGDLARTIRDNHELAAEITAISEQVISQ